MLGHGALGEFALGEIGNESLILTSNILQEVVTQLVQEGLIPTLPPELHHFTSLETAYKIVDGDNIRLSHAEYSNDQTEMAQAKDIIRSELAGQLANPFFAQVLPGYEALSPTLDAYIFCMCTGNSGNAKPQDILSQWRAYGQDGRGACLTLDSGDLGRRVSNTPGLRINPIIYQRPLQTKFVREILVRGLAAYKGGSTNARDATVAALVFATPLMKAPGFEEEREWRLIFMPPQQGPIPQFEFQARRDFLAPFVNLTHVWNDLRPDMVNIPALRATLPNAFIAYPQRNIHWYSIYSSILHMIRSIRAHQDLNVRSLNKIRPQPDAG